MFRSLRKTTLITIAVGESQNALRTIVEAMGVEEANENVAGRERKSPWPSLSRTVTPFALKS